MTKRPPWTPAPGSTLALVIVSAFLGGCAAAPQAAEPAESPKSIATESSAEQSSAEADAPPTDERTMGCGFAAIDQVANSEVPPAPSPAPLPGQPPDTRPPLLIEQAKALEILDAQLGATQLNCTSALPHKEAICSIAQRICSLADPGARGPSAPCEEAKTSCTNAAEKYQTKCGAP